MPKIHISRRFHMDAFLCACVILNCVRQLRQQTVTLSEMPKKKEKKEKKNTFVITAANNMQCGNVQLSMLS